MNTQSKIIWLNGTFDVLHAGHVKMFQKASEQGNRVVVGIDTDERIRELKGSNRPVNILKHRVEMLQAIKYIDFVFTFGNEKELIDLIEYIEPDVLCIGEEYRNKRIVGKELFKEIIYIPKYDDLSSTKILNKK